MSERRRTGIRLAVASAVIALSGFAIGARAELPGGDLSEQPVAVGEVDRAAIPVRDAGGHPQGRCGTKGTQDVTAAPRAI